MIGSTPLPIYNYPLSFLGKQTKLKLKSPLSLYNLQGSQVQVTRISIDTPDQRRSSANHRIIACVSLLAHFLKRRRGRPLLRMANTRGTCAALIIKGSSFIQLAGPARMTWYHAKVTRASSAIFARTTLNLHHPSYTCDCYLLHVCVYTRVYVIGKRGDKIERESERGGKRRMLEQEIKIEDTRGEKRGRDFRAVDVILCSMA